MKNICNKIKIDGIKIIGKIDLPPIELPINIRTRKNFFLKNDRCCYCHRPLGVSLKATREHIIPKSKGGSNNIKNLKPCCIECNNLRSNYTIAEFKKAARIIKMIMKSNLTYTMEDVETIIKNLSTV